MKQRRLLLKGIIIGFPITVFLLWITGAINLWFYDIGDIANNEKFYSFELKPIEGEYSVLIDLRDLESNVGKTLYDDGKHQIYVSNVFISDDANYDVSFRSSGKYNLYGATLVSGIVHERVQGGISFGLRANAKATYRGSTFKIYTSGSGLNYKDGDSFGFYVIPHDREVTLNIAEDPIIEITLSDLVMHKWSSKYGL